MIGYVKLAYHVSISDGYMEYRHYGTTALEYLNAKELLTHSDSYFLRNLSQSTLREKESIVSLKLYSFSHEDKEIQIEDPAFTIYTLGNFLVTWYLDKSEDYKQEEVKAIDGITDELVAINYYHKFALNNNSFGANLRRVYHVEFTIHRVLEVSPELETKIRARIGLAKLAGIPRAVYSQYVFKNTIV